MPKARFRDILKCADDNGFAVAAYDVYDYESAKWVVRAAERERVPVILMFYPDMGSFIPLSVIGGLLNLMAESAAVPVGVHLDHSRTFELAVSGIPAGFQSVMFDGSSLPFEENAEITKRVRDCARIFGADVEAELGIVGSGANRDDFLDPEKYTTAAAAAEFIDRTGADALAVAVGNSHGNYACEPCLDIKRLDEIDRATSAPLVLHGGSGIPSEQVRESIGHGIRKINVATEYLEKARGVYGRLMRESGSLLDVYEKAGEELAEHIRERLAWFNPKGWRLP
ncbi:MAG: class II fructose-bisphosphate aldolase [Clostridiales bacterium]|nr:class II fructose-bisphosphate aldolase [Clostridiales bacterium]